MKLLSLETSTEACSVALDLNGEITELFEIAPRRHTDLILDMVDQLLHQKKINLEQLDAIAVGNGPGSFMGTRLAVGVAQGLAFGAKLPIVAVSSLQALAQRAYRHLKKEAIAPAWDARMGEMYWGAYQWQEGLMLPISEDRLTPPSIVELPPGIDWQLVGNAWSIYQKELSSHLQSEAYLLHPSASAVVEVASYYFLRGEKMLPETVQPKYLRHQVAFHKNKTPL